MKKYLTEFDELQDALKQVRIDEPVMSYHLGRLVEDQDSYMKIQKLLDCPEMSGSHRYLYDLDVENLQEGEIDKINQLFDLGVKKGYIDNSFQEEFDREENPTAIIADEPDSVPQEDCCGDECCKKAPVACWTVLYSATKNGEIKTGECFSNAINVSAAKADCLAKLSRFGYENVSVLAIEAGDPDMCGAGGCCNENDILRNRLHNAHKDENLAESEEKEVEEDDMLKTRPHNGAALHNGHKPVNEEDKEVSDGEEVNEDGDEEASDEEIDEAGKNPYVAGMKVVTGGKVSTPTKKTTKKAKKLKEDDEDEDSDDSADNAADDSSDDSEDEGSDNAGDDSASDDSSDDSGDESSDDVDSDDSGDDSGDGEDSEGIEDSDEGSDEDAGEDSDDADSDDESDDDEDSADEDSENSDADDEDKELTDEEKAQYKNDYKQAFKDTMLKCKFEGKSFNDLTIDQKVDFFTKLSEKWTKADPKKFMSDKEEDQLESITIEQ